MSKSSRFLTAAALMLMAAPLTHASALIVVERRFPVNLYCPIDNDDFDLTFVAEGPFARITFVAGNYANGSWLHRRLDNIGVVAKSVYDLNKIVAAKFAQANGPAYKLVKAFNWTNDDQNAVAKAIAEDKVDAEKAAQQWVDANPDKVNAWLKAAQA